MPNGFLILENVLWLDLVGLEPGEGQRGQREEWIYLFPNLDSGFQEDGNLLSRCKVVPTALFRRAAGSTQLRI